MSDEQQKPMSLRCDSVSAAYGPITVCSDISIEVAAGEVVCLIGPNGAGKTSLVRAMAGLVQSRGDIILDGEALNDVPAHKRAAKGLALVPDDRALFPSMTVAENLRIGARMTPKQDRESAIARAIELLPIVGTLLPKFAGSLSGGEQQMLSIAKALAGRPKALVLDEPSQGLAPIILDSLRQTFKVLTEQGLPVLLVEQNQTFAQRAADRFYAVVGGRIVLEGDVSMLADRDAIAAAYLGSNNSKEGIS